MAESFLHLSAIERSQIYHGLAPRLGRSPLVLEKDVWVCWVLQALFSMPGRLPMAFKGGTSLSKVFGIIHRFSEDVDITLDYRGLSPDFNPFTEGVSRTRLRKFSDDLKAFVQHHVHGEILPHIRETAENEFGPGVIRLEASEDGEKIRAHYPSALNDPSTYVSQSVLIEFGGRNITEPCETHVVRPDIAPTLEMLDFPQPTVSVLSPARTFWEKATLIHVECQRTAFRSSAERLSRHWYDLAMLANHPTGEDALQDRSLLADVVRHKKIFYNTGYANYDACLQGRLRLIPDESALIALENDYRRMQDAGMFMGDVPPFSQLDERLRELEATINQDAHKAD